MGYERLSHTADLRLRVWGKDYEDLFRSAFIGMMAILKKEAPFSQKSKRLLKVESIDIAGLLIDFLNESLYNAQVNREIYTDIKFIKLEEKSLEAEIFGAPVNEFDEDIKAATYHEVDIRKNTEGLFETNIVFDI